MPGLVKDRAIATRVEWTQRISQVIFQVHVSLTLNDPNRSSDLLVRMQDIVEQRREGVVEGMRSEDAMTLFVMVSLPLTIGMGVDIVRRCWD